MKFILRYTLVFILIGSALIANGQNSNAIVFTENGERFTLILNGLRQNDQPETNVKVEGLNAEFYKLKVLFENTELGENDFNMYLEKGTETTYVIKKNRKDEYVLRLMSSVPVAQAPPSPKSTQVITYDPNAPVYVPAETVTQQTTTTTTTSGSPGGSGVSMGINVSETGGNISMNVSGFDETTTQHSTTVTTTTTSSSTIHSTPAEVPPVYLPGYSGPVGCPSPMNPGDFQAMKKSIDSKTFEDSKVTMAKQVINSNCLFSDQVKEVLDLFTYEDSKLDIAKYAYSRTYDIGNYFKVNDAFTFESSIEELNDFIESGD